MKRAVACARLDMLSLKPELKDFDVTILGFIFVGCLLQSTLLLFSMQMLNGVLHFSKIFDIEEKQRLHALRATLGVQRKDIVLGRYLLGISVQIMLVLLLLPAITVYHLVSRPDETMVQSFFLLSLIFSLSLVVVAVRYFFAFAFRLVRFEVRWLIPLVVLLILCGGSVGGGALLHFHGYYATSIKAFWTLYLKNGALYQILLCSAPIFLALVILGLSCLLSCVFFERRDLLDFLVKQVKEFVRVTLRAVNSQRYFVNPDGSIIRLECKRVPCVGCLRGVRILPNSLRRASTPLQLVKIRQQRLARHEARQLRDRFIYGALGLSFLGIAIFIIANIHIL